MSPDPKQTLKSFVKSSLEDPAGAEAAWLAKRLAKEFHGQVQAVLYYGSCLRTGKTRGLILDFYIIVEDYGKAYASRPLAFANRVLPPNVFYREAHKGKAAHRAKVAVLSLEDFLFRTSKACLNVSVWARFSQPARLVFCRDNKTRVAIIDAVAAAHRTMIAASLPLLDRVKTPENIWSNALTLTYGAELRSEKTGKGAELYKLNQAYFEALTPLVLKSLEGEAAPAAARWAWVLRRAGGKAVSLARLIKAAFTFAGGIDYLVWKIERSSGVKITLKPWQRRHPLVAGAFLFLRLRLKGAFR